MSATFACQWDRETCMWQIVSPSGHIIYESANKEHALRTCQRISQPRPARPIARQAADETPAQPPCSEEPARCAPSKACHAPRPQPASGGRWLAAVGLSIAAVAGFLTYRLSSAPNEAAPSRPEATALSRPAMLYKPSAAPTEQPASLAAQPVWEVRQQEQRLVELRPVWETVEREEAYTVRRPVVETSVRQEKFTVQQPVVTFQDQPTDQGSWVDRQVYVPSGKTATRFQWTRGGWTTSARTGIPYWKPPLLVPTQVELPGAYRIDRVWQAKVVTQRVPQVTYTPRVETRQVSTPTVRYVEERQVRKVPVRVCRMVEHEVVRKVPVLTCRLPGKDLGTPLPCPAPQGNRVSPQPAIESAVPQPAPGERQPVPATPRDSEKTNPDRVAALTSA